MAPVLMSNTERALAITGGSKSAPAREGGALPPTETTEVPNGNCSTNGAVESRATTHAIAEWQASFWRKSKDCHHVILVMLSLRANEHRQQLQLEGILAQHLPGLCTPSSEDAFFAMLEQETITDANLCQSVLEFLAKWPHQHEATYQELLVDSAVKGHINVCLPKEVSMWLWIRRRLNGGIYMTEEEAGSWIIQVVPNSDFRRRIVRQYEISSAVATQD